MEDQARQFAQLVATYSATRPAAERLFIATGGGPGPYQSLGNQLQCEAKGGQWLPSVNNSGLPVVAGAREHARRCAALASLGAAATAATRPGISAGAGALKPAPTSRSRALARLIRCAIVASGTSNRQTKALAASVRDAVKGRGMQVLRTEGEANGEWIIVDCGAAVAHIMQPGIREYYHLEEIWGDKPVNMKLDSAVKGLVKAAEPKPAVKTAATKAEPKKAAASARPSSPMIRKPGKPTRRFPSAPNTVNWLTSATRSKPPGPPLPTVNAMRCWLR